MCPKSSTIRVYLLHTCPVGARSWLFTSTAAWLCSLDGSEHCQDCTCNESSGSFAVRNGRLHVLYLPIMVCLTFMLLQFARTAYRWGH